MGAKFCIECGTALGEVKERPARVSSRMKATTTISFDSWFHDQCPVERNLQNWKYCPACGSGLALDGTKVRCPTCNRDLPSLYQFCLNG
ncbi:MAG: hypothetical protein ACYCW6_16170 [Candidatus Xenobia bacterium]